MIFQLFLILDFVIVLFAQVGDIIDVVNTKKSNLEVNISSDDEGFQICSNISALICYSTKSRSNVFIKIPSDNTDNCLEFEHSSDIYELLYPSFNSNTPPGCLALSLYNSNNKLIFTYESDNHINFLNYQPHKCQNSFAVRLHSHADLLLSQNKLIDAEFIYRAAISLYAPLSYDSCSEIVRLEGNLSRAYNSLGSTLYALTNWAESNHSFTQALENMIKKDPKEISRILANIGATTFKLKQYELAKRFYEDAILQYSAALLSSSSETVRKMLLISQGRCFSSLGTTLRAMGCYHKAIWNYHEAITIFTSQHGTEHTNVKKLHTYIESTESQRLLDNKDSKSTLCSDTAIPIAIINDTITEQIQPPIPIELLLLQNESLISTDTSHASVYSTLFTISFLFLSVLFLLVKLYSFLIDAIKAYKNYQLRRKYTNSSENSIWEWFVSFFRSPRNIIEIEQISLPRTGNSIDVDDNVVGETEVELVDQEEVDQEVIVESTVDLDIKDTPTSTKVEVDDDCCKNDFSIDYDSNDPDMGDLNSTYITQEISEFSNASQGVEETSEICDADGESDEISSAVLNSMLEDILDQYTAAKTEVAEILQSSPTELEVEKVDDYSKLVVDTHRSSSSSIGGSGSAQNFSDDAGGDSSTALQVSDRSTSLTSPTTNTKEGASPSQFSSSQSPSPGSHTRSSSLSSSTSPAARKMHQRHSSESLVVTQSFSDSCEFDMNDSQLFSQSSRSRRSKTDHVAPFRVPRFTHMDLFEGFGSPDSLPDDSYNMTFDDEIKAIRGRLRIEAIQKKRQEEQERLRQKSAEDEILEAEKAKRDYERLKERIPSVRERSKRYRAKSAERGLKIRMEANAQSKLFAEEAARLQEMTQQNELCHARDAALKHIEMKFQRIIEKDGAGAGGDDSFSLGSEDTSTCRQRIYSESFVEEMTQLMTLVENRNKASIKADHAVRVQEELLSEFVDKTKILPVSDRVFISAEGEKTEKIVRKRMKISIEADRLLRNLDQRMVWEKKAVRAKMMADKKKIQAKEAQKDFNEANTKLRTLSQRKDSEIALVARAVQRASETQAVAHSGDAKLSGRTSMEQEDSQILDGSKREQARILVDVELKTIRATEVEKRKLISSMTEDDETLRFQAAEKAKAAIVEARHRILEEERLEEERRQLALELRAKQAQEEERLKLLEEYNRNRLAAELRAKETEAYQQELLRKELERERTLRLLAEENERQAAENERLRKLAEKEAAEERQRRMASLTRSLEEEERRRLVEQQGQASEESERQRVAEEDRLRDQAEAEARRLAAELKIKKDVEMERLHHQAEEERLRLEAEGHLKASEQETRRLEEEARAIQAAEVERLRLLSEKAAAAAAAEEEEENRRLQMQRKALEEAEKERMRLAEEKAKAEEELERLRLLAEEEEKEKARLLEEQKQKEEEAAEQERLLQLAKKAAEEEEERVRKEADEQAKEWQRKEAAIKSRQAAEEERLRILTERAAEAQRLELEEEERKRAAEAEAAKRRLEKLQKLEEERKKPVEKSPTSNWMKLKQVVDVTNAFSQSKLKSVVKAIVSPSSVESKDVNLNAIPERDSAAEEAERKRLAEEAEAKRVEIERARVAAEEELMRQKQERLRVAAEEETRKREEEKEKAREAAKAKAKRFEEERAKASKGLAAAAAAEGGGGGLGTPNAASKPSIKLSGIPAKEPTSSGKVNWGTLRSVQKVLTESPDVSNRSRLRKVSDASGSPVTSTDGNAVDLNAIPERDYAAEEAERKRLVEEAEAKRVEIERARVAAEEELMRQKQERLRVAAEEETRKREEEKEKAREAAKAKAKRFEEERAKAAPVTPKATMVVKSVLKESPSDKATSTSAAISPGDSKVATTAFQPSSFSGQAGATTIVVDAKTRTWEDPKEASKLTMASRNSRFEEERQLYAKESEDRKIQNMERLHRRDPSHGSNTPTATDSTRPDEKVAKSSRESSSDTASRGRAERLVASPEDEAKLWQEKREKAQTEAAARAAKREEEFAHMMGPSSLRQRYNSSSSSSGNSSKPS